MFKGLLSYYLLFAFEISNIYCLRTMNLQYPVYTFSIQNNQIEMENDLCGIFGVWSRYMPLSNIVQVGNIGILDSNCFHLLNAQEQTTKRINFLHYECLDFETKQIHKYVQFIDNSGIDHIIQIPIDDTFYENVWYYIEFRLYPTEKLFKIHLQQQGQQPLSQNYQIEKPFYDQYLIVIVGGDLKIENNQQLYTSQNENLSYFPGKIRVQDFYQSYVLEYCEDYNEFIEENYGACECRISYKTPINDQIISKQDKLFFISENINCETFLLSGWIKINDIHTYVKEFDYKFLKLFGNFMKPQLTDDNLAAFQLTYRISSNGNQIIVSTYSYTFPTVNIDFSKNSFLIEEVFNFASNIKLWHYFVVRKYKTNINIQITFYEGYRQEKFEFNKEVKQFNLLQFKLLYGNLFQLSSNYLKLQIQGFQFQNCPDFQEQPIDCHATCKECDGPTQNDCLSCFESSNRIYLPEFKQCLCKYGMIDQGYICITQQSLNLTTTSDEFTYNGCKYGYYEMDGICEKCPSIISKNLVTCLECLQNTKEWLSTGCCEIIIYSDNEGNTLKQFEEFGCHFLSGNKVLDEDICLSCDIMEPDIKYPYPIPRLAYCYQPYYRNFEKKCILCDIKYCVYCFQYFGSDQTKTTLDQVFDYDIVGEEIKTGCAQCIDGFMYSFEKEQCIYQNPSIPNCLRAYVTKSGSEICTLSSIDDFSVAPEIINCQHLILNCKHCIQTPEMIIRCVICEDGYKASAITGICTKCSFLENSKVCVEWNQYNLEPWKWFIQSFRIKFLNLQNFYNVGILRISVEYVLECVDGYKVINNECKKYCNDNCLVCKANTLKSYFYCEKCGLNKYKQPIRFQNNGICIACSSLCQACEERSTEEIQKINSLFVITSESSIYTLKCLQKVPLPNITIDPILSIAYYCFNEDCNRLLEYAVLSQIFDYIEAYFNYEYFNEIGLQQIALILKMNSEYADRYYPTFSNDLKEKVFSLQLVQVRLEGDLQPINFSPLFKILNCDEITIKQIVYNIQTKLELTFQNREQSISVNIIDTSFYSDQANPIQLQIIEDNNLNYNLQNVLIYDANIYNSSIFSVTQTDLEGIINITNLTLSNCSFQNSTLLFFSNFNKKIIIDNLTINSCQFYNSSIIRFNFTSFYFADIIIKNVNIQNSLFQDSIFLYNNANSSVKINQFLLLKSQINGSRFISFSKNFQFNNALLKENLLKDVQLLLQLSLSFLNSKIMIDNFKILKNEFFNFQIFNTELNQVMNQVHSTLSYFQFEDNLPDPQKNQLYLFIITCQHLLISNVLLKNTQNFRFFSFIAIPTIRIENIIYENQYQSEKVPFTIECLQNSATNSQLLQVQGFSNIMLQYIQIKNQISIDKSIISIQSNPLVDFNQIEQILFREVTFIGNILLKINLGIFFSLFEIYSEKTQKIIIENIIFQENIFHSYEADPSDNSASLAHIESGESKIRISNILCSNNTLTNSSNSFISIISDEISVEKFQTFNHNYLDAKLWQKYYQLQIHSLFNQNQIIYLIKSTYKIDTIGGGLSITASQIQFNNGLFNNIIASSSIIFKINLKGNGIVIIKNCDIAYAQAQLISTTQVNGAMTIDARRSLLTIQIENLNVKYVQNKLSSSIFSITPSLIKNKITLKQIYALNCFSLLNQLLHLEFDYKNAENNIVIIENLHILQTEAAFMLYVQSVGKLNRIDIEKAIQDNAILNMIGCQAYIKQVLIEGVLSSSILKIVDYAKIVLTNFQFQYISTFYPLHLIDLSQTNVLQSDLMLNNFSIQNGNSFQFNKYQLNYYQNNLNVDQQIKQCTLISDYVTDQSSDSESIHIFFEEMIQNSNQNGSLIRINSITNQTPITVKKILIQNNNCEHCLNGLLYFELVDFKIIKIQQIQCVLNFIKRNGCILAISKNSLDRKFIIDQSTFISNQGTQGTGVQGQNIRVVLANSRIINNVASQKGGGIYFNPILSSFLLYQTLICQNSAQIGGGVYLEGNSSLSNYNFIQSLMIQNSAQVSSNNLYEVPSHLALQINYQVMHSLKQEIDNQIIYLLQLHPYKIISQNQVIKTNYLTIPSGQMLSNYELYNPKLRKYISYLKDISVIFKNSRNEKQHSIINSTCNLTQEIYDIQSQIALDSLQLYSIGYNSDTNKFDIGSTKFNFDPYQQESKKYEILVECKTDYQYKILSYKMRVNSFFCQLGEFYISEGCQACQSEQGFYSVTYNSTKCSIFDKTKFEAITTNQILLKPGYWRPNYISDYVELCYKNIYQCKGGWSVGDDICIKGHIGGLCEECDNFNIKGDGQFFKNQQQLDCQQCQELSKRVIAFLLILIWAILSTLLTIRSIEKSNQLFRYLKLKLKFADILFNLDQDHESILLKLYLNYLWIFSLIFTFNINFSFTLSFLKQSSDTTYFMANFFECFLSEIEGIELIYSRIILTVGLIISQVLIIQFGCALFSFFTAQKYKSRIMSNTILYLYIQNYATLIKQFFSTLAIRKISQIDYIQGDVSLLYGSNNHFNWIYAFIIPGSALFGLIIPLSLYIFLYLKKNDLNKIKYRSHIGYLFNEYTRKNYFWEWIKLWNKTIIIIILIYFETDISLKASSLGLCLLIYQYLSQHFKPYNLQKFNLLDVQTGQLCSSAIFFAAVKYICDQQENYTLSSLIQTIIILISLILSYPFIRGILKVYFKKYKPGVFEIMLTICKNYYPNSKFTKYLSLRLIILRQREKKIKSHFQKMKQAFKKRKQNEKKQQKIVLNSNLSKNNTMNLLLNQSQKKEFDNS
ncbi:unnamed protein product [Paramecium primaurelia]|uniref:Transmembrane protein n=2 Tax=Paramecium primaurelia TaxID=5886 RepID=A0A8S1QG08_PARPR|nr:unnamed protein product [Paramecium primaurelia]